MSLPLWLSLAEAAPLAGCDEDDLLILGLHGIVRAKMRYGREFVHRDDVLWMGAAREAAPNGRALRLSEGAS